MRITNSEISLIHSVLKKHLTDINHTVYLFGSRLDDQKKGGDIDLLLKVDFSDFAKIYDIKYLIKFDLESDLGDQRVDLTLITNQKIQDDFFINTVMTKAVQI